MPNIQNEVHAWLSKDCCRSMQVHTHVSGWRVEFFDYHHALSFGHGTTLDAAMTMAMTFLPAWEDNLKKTKQVEALRKKGELELQLAAINKELEKLE